jgi:hypothetical protein
MNPLQFALGIFLPGIRSRLNGSVDQVKRAAADDAILLADIYADQFEETLSNRLMLRQQRLLGSDVAELSPDVREEIRPAATVPETRLERQLRDSIKVVTASKATRKAK